MNYGAGYTFIGSGKKPAPALGKVFERNLYFQFNPGLSRDIPVTMHSDLHIHLVHSSNSK